MDFESVKHLAIQQVVSIEEVKVILDYIINNVKARLDINDSSTRLCKESSMEVWNLCDRLNIPYIPFNLGSFGMSEMEHHFGITGFQTEHGQICFLIDLTYIQFTDSKYAINEKEKNTTKLVSSPGNFISEENKKQLLESRYLILTEKNFDDYISSFIESYRLANHIDERQSYDKAYDLLGEYNINLVNKDYLNNQGITY